MSKPIRLTISYNEHIRFSYTVDTFNQCLHVKLGKGVPDTFMKDAVCEAYDHYNSQHPDAEFIHHSAVVDGCDENVSNPKIAKTFTFSIHDHTELRETNYDSWLASLPVVKENEYQCSVCKGVFEKTWDETEAIAEMQAEFGQGATVDKADVICDDCYNKIMKQIKN